MARLILKGSVLLSAMLLLGCVSRSELTESVKSAPSRATLLSAEEITPGVPLTQTPVPASPINCTKPQSDARVEVTSDKLTYQSGEIILVTICNYLPDVIYAPPQGGCSVVTIQRLENTHWVMEGICPAQEVHVFIVPPKSELTRALVPTSQSTGDQGPITSEPIPPYVFEGNLKDLPTSAPSRFPVIDVPEGAGAPPFSLLKNDLPPGTYRIEFSFTIGHPSDSIQTTYSSNFTVID